MDSPALRDVLNSNYNTQPDDCTWLSLGLAQAVENAEATIALIEWTRNLRKLPKTRARLPILKFEKKLSRTRTRLPILPVKRLRKTRTRLQTLEVPSVDGMPGGSFSSPEEADTYRALLSAALGIEYEIELETIPDLGKAAEFNFYVMDEWAQLKQKGGYKTNAGGMRGWWTLASKITPLHKDLMQEVWLMHGDRLDPFAMSTRYFIYLEQGIHEKLDEYWASQLDLILDQGFGEDVL